jgi:hypothetical protein
MDYVRFATPHAVADNRDTTSFPANFRVARVTHREADGTTNTPLASNGALLLPTGADFLLGRAGYWVETDRSALAGGPLVELTPGARSAQAAWLAVRQSDDRPQRLTTIDIDTDVQPGQRPKLAVTDLGPSAPAGAQVALIPDSKGSIWFAWQAAGNWTLRQIHPVLPGRGPTLSAPGLREPPRFLFLTDVVGWFGDGFLLTDTGGCRIAHADKIGSDGGGLRLLAPEVKDWVRPWPPPSLAARYEYEVVLSRRWGAVAGDARVIALRRQAGRPGAEAFAVRTTADNCGLLVEPAAKRLDTGPLRGFRPRLWFPGSDEYVVWDRDGPRGAVGLLFPVPVDGVSAVRSAAWLRGLAEGLEPGRGAVVCRLEPPIRPRRTSAPLPVPHPEGP